MRARAVVAVAVAVLFGWAGKAVGDEPDPWAKVPPLPTACYQRDGYAAKVAAARERNESDRVRQESINRELTDKVKNVDPMELASRQQQYMMDHPQEALALMQRNVQVGGTFADDGVAAANELLAFDRELDEIDTRYKAALDRALDPVKAKFADLDVRAMKDPELTEAGAFYKPWATKEWNGLAAEENAVYERVGAEWWGASGAYHGWLKRVRAHYVKALPALEEAENVAAGFQVQLVGTPAAPFRPVSVYAAIAGYLDRVDKVFLKRRPEPLQPRPLQ